MDDELEVESYASATALRHLDALDDEMVALAHGLVRAGGSVLDVGTGPGQIPIKLALREPSLVIHAIDLSDPMLRRAAMDAARWGVDMRILLHRGDALAIPYDAGLFDLVMCNSLLHHAADPVRLVQEMDRVCRPGGALLLRDLRRPKRFALTAHLRRHGRHYEGKMRELFEASVRAAYTRAELDAIVRASGVRGVRVRTLGAAHLGFERRPA